METTKTQALECAPMQQQLTNYSSPFQSHFNKPPRIYSVAFPSESPYTDQSYKDECDVNAIMDRYQTQGIIPAINMRAPQYLDVSEGFDFTAMQEQVLEAKGLFSELPSVLRERFANDPARFIEYCQDPDNHHEMSKLGLIVKTPAVTGSPPGETGLPASGSAPVNSVVPQPSSSPS